MMDKNTMLSPSVAVARPRILLVEDDAAVRHALQLLLISKGYDVRAYPGSAGLADNPDAMSAMCLVADLILPGDNAIVLLRRLKQAGWSAPAILISGNLSDDWKAKALDAGYDAVLSKPIADTVLTDLVARFAAERMSGANKQDPV